MHSARQSQEGQSLSKPHPLPNVAAGKIKQTLIPLFGLTPNRSALCQALQDSMRRSQHPSGSQSKWAPMSQMVLYACNASPAD